MRYRNVEGVRMTEQTDREHHNGNGNKHEDAQVARGVGRVEPSTLQRKTQRKNAKRRHKIWVLRKPGLELKPNHVCKQRLKPNHVCNEGGFKLDDAKIRPKGKI